MGRVTINVAIELEGDGAAADRAADLVTGMPEFFQAVIAERAAQDQQWGGPAHDDQHSPVIWEEVIASHVMRLTKDGIDCAPADDYRQRLIKIAAVAVAAAQSWDRLTAPGEAGEVIAVG